MVQPSLIRRTYTRDEIRRVLGISKQQLKRWETESMIPASGSFDSHDLSAFKSLLTISKKRVAYQRVRGVLASLREHYVLGEYPLRDVQFLNEDGRLVVRVDGSKLEPFSGQLLLEFDPPRAPELIRARPEADLAYRGRRKWEAETWFQKALELETAGAPPREAIPFYEKALDCDPDLAPAHLNLGTLYFQARSYKKARKHYEEALRVDERYSLAYYNLGNLYDEIGERENAIHYYGEAARLDPTYPDVHYNLALLHQTSGQLLRALHHWKTYLRLDSSSAWADIARRQMAAIRKNTIVMGQRTPAAAEPTA